MQNQKSYIWVTFQRAGIHQYPGASGEQHYLKNQHRHLFKFRVSIEVQSFDREIEFHAFLNWLESLYDTNTLQLLDKSCEMISNELFSNITAMYPYRDIDIELSEDGECGSHITYHVDKAG